MTGLCHFSSGRAGLARNAEGFSWLVLGVFLGSQVLEQAWSGENLSTGSGASLVFLCLLTPQWEYEDFRACHNAVGARSALAENSV